MEEEDAPLGLVAQGVRLVEPTDFKFKRPDLEIGRVFLFY
jgi:hypothetical protein